MYRFKRIAKERIQLAEQRPMYTAANPAPKVRHLPLLFLHFHNVCLTNITFDFSLPFCRIICWLLCFTCLKRHPSPQRLGNERLQELLQQLQQQKGGSVRNPSLLTPKCSTLRTMKMRPSMLQYRSKPNLNFFSKTNNVYECYLIL